MRRGDFGCLRREKRRAVRRRRGFDGSEYARPGSNSNANWVNRLNAVLPIGTMVIVPDDSEFRSFENGHREPAD